VAVPEVSDRAEVAAARAAYLEKLEERQRAS
jgi:TPP-dependent trihydroxycyclohexane-1,2-dione (THcHDO) dehydratase